VQGFVKIAFKILRDAPHGQTHGRLTDNFENIASLAEVIKMLDLT